MAEAGVGVDAGRLPTINLANALGALPAFQREFRERFFGLLEPSEIRAIDKQEIDAVRRAFAIWSQFVQHAERTISYGVAEATRKFDAALDEVRRKLKAKLKGLKLASGRMTASIRSEEAHEGNEPALWIVCDVGDPTSIYEACDLVHRAIVAALPHGMNLAPNAPGLLGAVTHDFRFGA